MKTAHLFTSTLFFLLFLFSNSFSAQTVYIAETGKKYHVKSCPAVQYHKTEMQLKEAKKKGYEPCTGCGAEKIVPLEEKSKEKKKQ